MEWSRRLRPVFLIFPFTDFGKYFLQEKSLPRNAQKRSTSKPFCLWMSCWKFLRQYHRIAPSITLVKNCHANKDCIRHLRIIVHRNGSCCGHWQTLDTGLPCVQIVTNGIAGRWQRCCAKSMISAHILWCRHDHFHHLLGAERDQGPMPRSSDLNRTPGVDRKHPGHRHHQDGDSNNHFNKRKALLFTLDHAIFPVLWIPTLSPTSHTHLKGFSLQKNIFQHIEKIHYRAREIFSEENFHLS